MSNITSSYSRLVMTGTYAQEDARDSEQTAYVEAPARSPPDERALSNMRQH